jgi:hypothetical protein
MAKSQNRRATKRVTFGNRDEAMKALRLVLETGKKTRARSREISDHLDVVLDKTSEPA